MDSFNDGRFSPDGIIACAYSDFTSGRMELNSDSQMVDLPRLAEWPKRRSWQARSDSEKTAALPGLQGGPVKGMTFREARDVPQ